MSLHVRIATVVAVWLVATGLLAMAYSRHNSRAPPPLLEVPKQESSFGKSDRQPIRVVPTAKAPEPAPPPVAEPAPPPVRVDLPPPAKADPPPPPERKQRDICASTGGWKVVTRGGRSWRCAYAHERRTRRHAEKKEEPKPEAPPQQKPTWWPF